MKSLLHTSLFALATCGVVAATPAGAAPQQLPAHPLQLLLTGNTLHLAVGSGTAMLYFDPQGEVRALMPNGTHDSGAWSLKAPDTYCISWVKGPKDSCTTVNWAPGSIALADAQGKPRGMVMRIVPGEEAGLRP